MASTLNKSMGPLVLRLDGIFLGLAGTLAMAAELVGHFLGKGPFAALHGSPHTIGGFEAHGLALLIGVLLFRAALMADRRQWHVVGLLTHLFLGICNLAFWITFVYQDVETVGIVATSLHAAFSLAHIACLRAASLRQ